MIAGIVRTVYLVKAEGPDIDKTWNTFNAIVAGKTEGDFGIICACAPSLRSCFKYHFGNRSRMGGSTNENSQPSGRSKDQPRPSLNEITPRPEAGKSPALSEEILMSARLSDVEAARFREDDWFSIEQGSPTSESAWIVHAEGAEGSRHIVDAMRPQSWLKGKESARR